MEPKHQQLPSRIHRRRSNFVTGALIAAGLFCSTIACAARISVIDDSLSPVGGAEVWVDCQLRGTTDALGSIDVASLPEGAEVVARKIVATTMSERTEHDGDWAYRVWHTNIVQQDNGDWTAARATGWDMQVSISAENGVIGFNLLASLNYNATSEVLEDIRASFEATSTRIYDAADGQMVFEHVNLFEDERGFADADARIFMQGFRSNADVVARGMSRKGTSMRMGIKPYLWQQPQAASILSHEFSHYGVGAHDEYREHGDDTEKRQCPADGDQALPQDFRASLLSNHSVSEFCHDGNHNVHTDQGERSVWATLSANWDDGSLALRTPMSRGDGMSPPFYVVNPGPHQVPCMFRTSFRIVEAPTQACGELQAHARLYGSEVVGAEATLVHNGNEFELGTTVASRFIPPNDIRLSGVYVPVAVPGDRIRMHLHQRIGPNYSITLNGTGVVTGCDTMDIAMRERRYVAFYPSLILRIPDRRGLIQIPVLGDRTSLRSMALSVRQPGLPARDVDLRYDDATKQFAADVGYDAEYGPALDITLRAITTDGDELVTVSRADGALFHSDGAGTGPGGVVPPQTRDNDRWDLFAADAPIGLNVDRASMSDGVSVSVTTIEPPAALPWGWIFIARPALVQGSDGLKSFARLGMAYDAQAICGGGEDAPLCIPQPGKFRLVRFNGRSWDKIDMRSDPEQASVTADITDWGIYAVIARPL